MDKMQEKFPRKVPVVKMQEKFPRKLPVVKMQSPKSISSLRVKFLSSLKGYYCYCQGSNVF